MSSWERGYGDFEMKPDLDTLRLIPWHQGTALCMADLQWPDGDARRGLAAPDPARASSTASPSAGCTPSAATELEFMVFRDSYDEAARKRLPRPATRPTSTTSTTRCSGTSRVEPLIRRIRNGMAGAGLRVENSKGECNFGQHEINFAYGPVLQTADEHTIYKNGAKEIADQEGMAITFMAKFDEREGNSCHIHLSLRREDGSAAVRRRRRRVRALPRRPARLPAGACLLYAPNVNSYKRFAAGSFAPTAVAWGNDNRTCALRVVGHGPSRAHRAAAARRRRQPVPRAQRRSSPPACTAWTPGSSSSRRSRATPTRRTSRACRARCAPRATRSPARDGRARGVRRGGRRPLPQQRRRRARRRSRRRSPTGSACAASSGCEPARSARRVFAPVRSQTAFEETLERLGTAIKLGLLEPGARLPAERELCRAAGHLALDAAPGAHRARAERAPARDARAQRRHVRRRVAAAAPTPRARAARRLARRLRPAPRRRARRRACSPPSARSRGARRRSTSSWRRWTRRSRTSPPTARPTCAGTSGSPRRRARRGWSRR